MNSDPVAVSIILSDLVIKEQGTGKTSLIGIFNNLGVPHFPFPTPSFYATVALTNLTASAVKEFNIVIRIEDPLTGGVLTNVGGNIKFQEPFVLTKEMTFEVSFPVLPFLIPKPGNYEVLILVNNNPAGKRLFVINAITAAATPQ
jgi:hypothetical protein